MDSGSKAVMHRLHARPSHEKTNPRRALAALNPAAHALEGGRIKSHRKKRSQTGAGYLLTPGLAPRIAEARRQRSELIEAEEDINLELPN
jgi:hypothetical protein